MKYEVIRHFTDAQDNEYAYHEGDEYPREGLSVTDARIKDLLSGNNFQRVPLIKRVEKISNAPKDEAIWTAEDVDHMPFMKLKSIAKKNGVTVEDKKADEIRSELKKKLEL